MQEKTALNRFGDVILWLGTTVLVLSFVGVIVGLYEFLAGNNKAVGWDDITMFAVAGVAGWLFFPSIAYIFNGRTPVAVIKGWLDRS